MPPLNIISRSPHQFFQEEKNSNFFFLQILQLSNWGQSPGDFLEGCAIYFAGSAAIEVRVVLTITSNYVKKYSEWLMLATIFSSYATTTCSINLYISNVTTLPETRCHASEPLPINSAVHYRSFLEIKRFFKIFGDIAETGNYLTLLIMQAWGKSWYVSGKKQTNMFVVFKPHPAFKRTKMVRYHLNHNTADRVHLNPVKNYGYTT